MTSVLTAYTPLPSALPASQGVDPAHVRRYLEALGRDGCHSLMLLRDGRVLTKAWWRPYREEYPHILFSISKSFVSVAVGMAVADGVLDLDERVADIFADRLPCPPCEHMRRATVRHLLTMTLGHRGKSDLDFLAADDLLDECLRLYLETAPGTDFAYDNRCTYLCCAILQRRIGTTVHEYLEKRLFAKIGIRDSSWELSPQGITAGGWGLRTTTEAIARFGQFLLQGGTWNGERLLSGEYLAEAVANHVDTRQKSIVAAEDCWRGYGYFFWHSSFPGAYRADGALGQSVIVMPEQRMVAAMTAGTANRERLIEATWRELCPGIDRVAADHADAQRELERTVAGLELAPVPGEPTNAAAGKYSGKVYRLADNPLGVDRLSVELGDSDVLTLWLGDSRFRVEAGHGRWLDNDSGLDRDGGSDVSRVLYADVAASSAWEGDELVFCLCHVATPFVDSLRLIFSENGVEGSYACGPEFRARIGSCRLMGFPV